MRTPGVYMITIPSTTSVSLSYFLPHSFFPRPPPILSEISGNPAFWSVCVEPPSPSEPHVWKLPGLCCCLGQPFSRPPGPPSSPDDPQLPSLLAPGPLVLVSLLPCFISTHPSGASWTDARGWENFLGHVLSEHTFILPPRLVDSLTG